MERLAAAKAPAHSALPRDRVGVYNAIHGAEGFRVEGPVVIPKN